MDKKIKAYNLRKSVISIIHEMAVADSRKDSDWLDLYLAKNLLSQVKVKPKKEIAVGFKPPSLEQVKAYCNERLNSVDAESFIDHYASNGWMRGKTKIKDWKACVRTWEKNTQSRSQSSQHSKVTTKNINAAREWANESVR